MNFLLFITSPSLDASAKLTNSPNFVPPFTSIKFCVVQHLWKFFKKYFVSEIHFLKIFFMRANGISNYVQIENYYSFEIYIEMCLSLQMRSEINKLALNKLQKSPDLTWIYGRLFHLWKINKQIEEVTPCLRTPTMNIQSNGNPNPESQACISSSWQFLTLPL